MTDTQLAALLAFITAACGGLVTFFKWFATKHFESKAEDRKSRDENTKALVLFNDRSLQLLGKFDAVLERFSRVSDFVEEASGVHDTPPSAAFGEEATQKAKRHRTAPGGYRIRPRQDDKG